MSMRLRACAFALICITRVSSGQTSPPASPPSTPAVSIFVGGNFGPGWWTLDIDSRSRMKAKLVDGLDEPDPRRSLNRRERERLSYLLKDLPRSKARYSFLGPDYIDVTITFDLTVGTGVEARRYILNDTFADHAGSPELVPILKVMHFLHSLLGSQRVHLPPPVGGVVPK
jgi:hypothetical protein